MARVKGCVNAECVAHQKKIKFKEEELYCSRCGEALSYVCRKCYTKLDEPGELCIRHQADAADHADKNVFVGIAGNVKKAADTAGKGVGEAVSVIAENGEKAVSAVKGNAAKIGEKMKGSVPKPEIKIGFKGKSETIQPEETIEETE